ncbi:GntP family permease [Sphaerochaeta sp. PS]|uniref:GntP family permease n=1 Tax=Sphaerochaeta sp. PS TaxID=3076336 RepID=UPI0028A545BF|nr:GntP family permease [Sphaerochaeta sp. PS]MDT4761316.1 GntP family permease [Sphaerochaeta sp. PS]
MSGIALIITFIIAIAIMIVAISKWNVNPFLALMGVSLVLAIVVGIPLKDIPTTIGSGFSGIFSSIGIVIILGALIGTILEKTGAALKLAEMVVRLVGQKRPQLAMEIMGWVVSIPVFCDSGFVILDPIRKALRKKTQFSSVAMTVALSAGLYTSHVFIPPTPGPIAAAGTLGIGDNLFMVIVLGAVVSIPSLIIAYFYANYIGKRVRSAEDETQDLDGQDYDSLLKSFGKLPNGFLALAPILIPILCMALGSLAAALGWTGNVAALSKFIGSPIIALTVGLLFGVILLMHSGKIRDFNSMTTDTMKVVGPILFITAAGGVLGKVIASAGFVGYMNEHAAALSMVGIFFPFLISAILKSAQGSSTVAITTTAGIMGSFLEGGSMMAALGLSTPLAAVLTVMAIGAGAMTVSHANDSYFWVVTNFGGMKPEDGYKTQTMVTLLMGIASMIFIWILSLFLL